MKALEDNDTGARSKGAMHALTGIILSTVDVGSELYSIIVSLHLQSGVVSRKNVDTASKSRRFSLR
jgi:hypothetical protein